MDTTIAYWLSVLSRTTRPGYERRLLLDGLLETCDVSMHLQYIALSVTP